MDNFKPKIDIGYLKDYPEHIEQVAFWFHEEWHGTEENWSFEETLDYIRKHDCNKDKLNITMIALDGDRMVGTIQLMADDLLPGWADVGPWIGGLYIDPDYRHHGIAYRLGYAMMSKAMNMGFDCMYMFTDSIHRLPQRHHARVVGQAAYAGKTVRIYKKDLF